MSALKITLFRTFKDIVMDLMVYKCRFGKERYIKQINHTREWHKMVEFCLSAEKGHIWKESGVTAQGRREVEVGTLLLGKFEVYRARFGTKW